MSAAFLLVSVLAVGVEVESSDPEFGKRVEKVAKQLVGVRQLEFKEPVSVGVMDRKQLATKMDELFDEELPSKKAHSQQLLLVRLGLIPEDMDLREFLQGLHAEGIAGFYDHDKQELFMVAEEGTEDDEDEIVIAHELIHALQDQHYDLSAMHDLLEGEDDMQLALMAMVEGDATVGMMEYMIAEQNPGPIAKFIMRKTSNVLMSNADLLMGLAGLAGEDVLSKAPNAIKQEMIFPYTSGLRFVRHGIGNDKWSVLSDVYKNPPLSTEQILHPAKYFDEKDWPTRVITPDVGVLLPGKWAPVSRLVAGEFGIRLVLSEHRPKLDEDESDLLVAKVAATGWDGDEVNLYRDRANPKRFAVVWYSTWDSEEDAIEYEQALARWVVARHKDARPVKKATGTWKVGPNHIRIERNGNDIVLLDAPHASVHGTVIKALWEKTWKQEIQDAKKLDPLW